MLAIVRGLISSHPRLDFSARKNWTHSSPWADYKGFLQNLGSLSCGVGLTAFGGGVVVGDCNARVDIVVVGGGVITITLRLILVVFVGVLLLLLVMWK